MAQVLAFDMDDLEAVVTKPLAALAAQDRVMWRKAYEALRKHQVKPEDYSEQADSLIVRSFDGEAVLRPGELPSRKALGLVLREFCLRLARRGLSLNEPHRSVTYPNLDDERMLSEELANTETWEYLIDAVFTRGAMPDELWFMDGGSYVATNWLGPKSIRRALALEAEDSLGQLMRDQTAYPAADVASLIGLFSECAAQNWQVLMFEPGS